MSDLLTQSARSKPVVIAEAPKDRALLIDHLTVHPFLFAIYPLLFLYANNFEEVQLRQVLISMVFVILLTGLLLTWLKLLVKNSVKAGFLVSALLLLFFCYGGVRVYLFVGIFQIGKHQYWLPVWLLLFILYSTVVYKSRSTGKTLTRFLNLFSVLMVLITVGKLSLSLYGYQKINAAAYELKDLDSAVVNKVAGDVKSYPDIYYIILDGYASSATLGSLYNYSDNELIRFLKERGFYVASDSAANYSYTFLSLASSLNMSHLHRLSEMKGLTSKFKKAPFHITEYNAVVRILKSRGYRYIHFGSRYKLTNRNRLADVNVNCDPQDFDIWLGLLMKNTMLSIIEPYFPYEWFADIKTESKKCLCPFTEISTALSATGPKFVFMHILLPHPPFFFKRNGALLSERMLLDIDSSWDKERYLEQLVFLNGKVKELIDRILSSTSRPPVIILQSDHGPASEMNWDDPNDLALKERMTIINAYLLPEGGEKALYNTITPVNSFRVVFNHYFGAEFELMEDRSYFSTWNQPYRFIDVTDKVHGDLKAVDQEAGAFNLSHK